MTILKTSIDRSKNIEPYMGLRMAKEDVDGQYGGRTHGLGVISTTL